MHSYYSEPFTDSEIEILARFFTNVDQPVFALKNMPEVVKGALFARYSRSPKSLRRLFLDEFYINPDFSIPQLSEIHDDSHGHIDTDRATTLYDRIFYEYGDDSVAQLGGVHIACEQVSNILTKVIEWGRLASYLEQSTRYIYFDKKLGGRDRFFVPSELDDHPELESDFIGVMQGLFELYRELSPQLQDYYEKKSPQTQSDSEFVWQTAIRGKVCDDIRGLLPAATLSNVGVYACGQALENMLVRMRAHPLAEVNHYADMILHELRLVMPAFMRRVDLPNRGVVTSNYYTAIRDSMQDHCQQLSEPLEPASEVDLVDWDPEGERKVVAATLFASSNHPESQLKRLVDEMDDEQVADILHSYVGNRTNRRHKPGRAFERTDYRFDIVADYGVFRDLQRHRMLTVEWQELSPRYGYTVPRSLGELGKEEAWHDAMQRTANLYDRISQTLSPTVAQYAIPLAYRIRFSLQMNAREAFHLLELRTAPGGHESYRKICQEMHRLIKTKAGHLNISNAMNFINLDNELLGRLDSARQVEQRLAKQNNGS